MTSIDALETRSRLLAKFDDGTLTKDDIVRYIALRDSEVHSTRDAHRQDIATIGDRLISEATGRGWCDIYDDVIAELNNQLIEKLPVRLVKRTKTITVTVSYLQPPGGDPWVLDECGLMQFLLDECDRQGAYLDAEVTHLTVNDD
jgi:hypothetical protein